MIQKEWWNGPSSILINRASERYAIAGNPKNFIQSGNVLLSLVENKEGTDYALGIYKPKNNFTILYSIDVQNETEIEGYSLVGKQVELSVKTINGSIKKIVLNLPE